MNLKDAREAYYTHSGKASELSRQLAFAGIAVIWIFRLGDQQPGRLAVPDGLLDPLQLFVVALLFDFSQYVYSALAWGTFHRHKEKALERDETVSFEAPRWINWPANVVFFLKLVAVSVAYFLLAAFIGQRI